VEKIILKLGERVLKEFPLVKPAMGIGRNPASDIHIDNLAVSGSHARIVKDGDTYVIEDLGSLNGTFIGGKRISRAELKDGDEILVGKHTLVFTKAEAGSPAKAGAPAAIERTMVIDTKRHRELSGRGREETHFPGGTVGVFTVEEGRAEPEEFEMKRSFATVGKGKSSDIRIKSFFGPSVAALLHRTEEGYFISPPESGKGPRLNLRAVKQRTPLKDGDAIEVGGVRLRFTLRATQ